MTDVNTKSFGANALTWAMIAGAALLFVEVTMSSMTPASPAKAATVQTVTVAHADRLARN